MMQCIILKSRLAGVICPSKALFILSQGGVDSIESQTLALKDVPNDPCVFWSVTVYAKQ